MRRGRLGKNNYILMNRTLIFEVPSITAEEGRLVISCPLLAYHVPAKYIRCTYYDNQSITYLLYNIFYDAAKLFEDGHQLLREEATESFLLL